MPLTPEIASEIRARYSAGETQLALSAEYGVSQPAISNVIRNRTYKDPTYEPVVRIGRPREKSSTPTAETSPPVVD